MIVVIGSPSGRSGASGTEATGLGVGIARAIAAGGAGVQVVGRVGEDDMGDRVLLDLAAHGVGHVAVLRTGGATTPVTTAAPAADDATPGAVVAADGDEPAGSGADGLTLDAADLELALRYLPDYRVVVTTPGLDARALETVVAAATWAAARLIVVVDQAGDAAGLPADATVLERPPDDDEAFATVVARYAIELDGGAEPAAAFAAASTGSGWTTVTD